LKTTGSWAGDEKSLPATVSEAFSGQPHGDADDAIVLDEGQCRQVPDDDRLQPCVNRDG
jgi:hypothetical protein